MSQEARRRRTAEPSPSEGIAQRRSIAVGCGIPIAIYLGLCLVVFALTRWRIVIVLAVPAIIWAGAALAELLYGMALLAAVRLQWAPRGIRCLVVSSNSPNWEEHIRANWIARFGHAAVTLNWSERESWRPTLAVRVFRHFCHPLGDYNPSVVVFQGLRHPLVFRFFQAFKQSKAGRPEYLARMEAELFNVIAGEGRGPR